MNYRKLEILTILLPPLLIGGFEFVRHIYLMAYLSMETGNYIITLLTLVLSVFYTTWMFRIIRRQNAQLAEEQARLAVYEERERLAKELHDGIAQTLFFLHVKLKQGHIEEAKTAVSAIDNHVRQAIFNLRSPSEETGSLHRRIEQWLTQWSTLTGIDVEQELSEMPDKLFSSAQEVQLFAVIQEAFNNIRKHSHAKNATIRLQPLADNGWQLMICDDGRGFINTDVGTDKYGLKMMAERARKLGATFAIQRRAEGGTELILNTRTGGKS